MNRLAPSLKKTWRTPQYLLVVVLLIGALIRIHGLIWTLPWFFHGDETRLINNGISVYETGGIQSYVLGVSDMTNYPPLRSWEIALTHGVLKLFFGDAPLWLQVLFGRIFSLLYALLTITFIYHLGRRATNHAAVGLLSALMFAIWPATVMFGQRGVADGAGLMFFTASAWLSIEAYRRFSYRQLVFATVAGILAALSKYNYATVLMLPAMMLLAFLLRVSPRYLVTRVILPSTILGLPLVYLAIRSVSSADLYYDYLNHTAHLEGEVRVLQQNGVSPDSPEFRAIVNQFPLTVPTRLERNFEIFSLFFPGIAIPIVLLGIGYAALRHSPEFDHLSLLALGICSFLTLLSFSLFRVTEGRQLMGAMVLLLVFWSVGIHGLAQYSKVAGAVVAAILMFPLAVESWTQNIEFTKPDTRLETVRWFNENVQEGSSIAVENIPYEFWEANGYDNPKHFLAERVYRLNDRSPKDWENQGFYYLVADRTSIEYGGYYAGHELQDLFDAGVEVLARFEGDAYSGPDRIIMLAFRPQVITDANYGHTFLLHGYDLENQVVQPGETLKYKFFWKALRAPGGDYIVFNHLFSLETGELVAQIDRPAGREATYPTSQWRQFEWVFDQFELPLPDDLPPGEYVLRVGLYDAQTGERLPVTDGVDGIFELFRISVEGKE